MTLDESRYQKAYERMRETMCDKHKSAATYMNYPSHYCLAQISGYNKLIAKSFEENRPVFEVELPTGARQVVTREWFRDLYAAFAVRVMELMS